MLSRIGVSLAATAALILTVVPAAEAAKLKAPATSAPAKGAVVETVPSFTWRSVRRAAEYEFQVAADAGFGSVVDKGSFRTRNTAATLKTSLANGTYFWRVRAITASDKAGRWSRPRSFEKAWMRAPELLEPSDALADDVADPSAGAAMDARAARDQVPGHDRHRPGSRESRGRARREAGRDAGNGLRAAGRSRSGHVLLGRHAGGRGQFKGRRSRVGSFSWGWPTPSSGRVLDLDPAAEVFDPLLQWDPVAGRERVRGRGQPDAPSSRPARRSFGGVANGTSIAPTVHLLNNTWLPLARARDRSRRQPRRVERGTGRSRRSSTTSRRRCATSACATTAA